VESYGWNEVPEDQKEQLPAEFKNASFRLLFETGIAAGAKVVKHFESGTNIRTVVIDLAPLLTYPRRCEDGLTLSDLSRLLLINNIGREDFMGVIISTVEKEAVKALLEKDLPAFFAGVLNNTSCKPAFLEATKELSLNVQEIEKPLCLVDDGGRRVEYQLYFVKDNAAGQLLRNGQAATL
jgi:hypothetical protein